MFVTLLEKSFNALTISYTRVVFFSNKKYHPFQNDMYTSKSKKLNIIKDNSGLIVHNTYSSIIFFFI